MTNWHYGKFTRNWKCQNIFYMSVSINTATVHYFGSRAELCLHIAAYGHCERVVHSVLLLKFIEHCNHPCFPLCAVLEESLLVSKAVMCRRIYCSPFLYILGWTIFFKCFSSFPLLCLCFGSDSCRALQTGSPWNCSPGYVLAPSVMNAVCSMLCLW